MSNLVVGSIHTSVPDQSGILKILIESTERERDHYKRALEEISTSIQEWKDSLVQEPAEDFIHAIKAWADKKLTKQ